MTQDHGKLCVKEVDMGCPAHQPFIYREVIVSDGRPQMVSFSDRRRRVVKAFTYDRTMEFTWTQESVFANGPRGTEVIVDFEIL